MLELEFDVESSLRFDEKSDRLERGVNALLFEVGSLVWSIERDVVPVRSGRLRDSIRLEVSGEEARIGPTVEYAGFVESPTRPHRIEPRRSRVLRFDVEGTTVFAAGVDHPGTRGAFFVEETVRRALPGVKRLLADSVREALR